MFLLSRRKLIVEWYLLLSGISKSLLKFCADLIKGWFGGIILKSTTFPSFSHIARKGGQKKECIVCLAFFLKSNNKALAFFPLNINPVSFFNPSTLSMSIISIT